MLNSFNLVKLMIEQKEDYFEDFDSEILKEPRKEEIDHQIMFKDYEQFDVDFDSRSNITQENNPPDEFEELIDQNEEIDEEELFNSLIDKAEMTNTEIKEIFHGDIETRPNKQGRHIPYLMAYSDNEGKQKYFFFLG